MTTLSINAPKSLQSEYEKILKSLSKAQGAHCIVLTSGGQLEHFEMQADNHDADHMYEDADWNFSRPYWIVSIVRRGLRFSPEQRLEELNLAWEGRSYHLSERVK
jgi:hypothetical protein